MIQIIYFIKYVKYFCVWQTYHLYPTDTSVATLSIIFYKSALYHVFLERCDVMLVL